MTQAQLVERTGVSRRTLIRWESNQAQPRRAELELVRAVLGMEEGDENEGWRRTLRLARGRLGLSYEDAAACLDMHPSTVRRFEEGHLGVTPSIARERIRSLPLHPSEAEAFVSPRSPIDRTDWTNFDLYHDRLLRDLNHEQIDWWQTASEYGRWLDEAHRHREAREVAQSAIDRDALSAAPKTFQFALRCILARSYFFDSWRSAQRGLYQLRKLKGLAVGRREICESQALMAECLALHGLRRPALEHIRRAVSIAEGLGGPILNQRRTDYAAALLRAGNAEAAREILPPVDSDGAIEFTTRARLMADIHTARGDAQKAAHWNELAETVIERERLHGRFRLCLRTKA